MIIYRITSTITQKSYIGQTIFNLEKRWKQHTQETPNTHFHKAIHKYGVECWSLEILENVENINLLNEREIYWIEYYDTFKNGYNLTIGGDGMKNYKHSTETIEKMRQTKLGKTFTDKHKHNLRQAKLGKHLSTAHKENIKQAKLGEKNPMFGIDITKEHRNKLSEAKKGNKHNNYGKHTSEETKEKIRQGMLAYIERKNKII
jgi:group I intron endonuclease